MDAAQRARAAIEARGREAMFRRCVATQGAHDPTTGRLLTLPANAMGLVYDDVPLVEPADVDLRGWPPGPGLRLPPAFPEPLAEACRHGPLVRLEAELADRAVTRPFTPALLHFCLVLALTGGHVEGAELLLGRGAPILRETPRVVLEPRGPRLAQAQQVALFAVLLRHGWTPNTPGHYGKVLLPVVAADGGEGETEDTSLLTWFLDHGADPNLGGQPDNRDRGGSSVMESCQALESAAYRGTPAAVALLLAAGARNENGHPLHVAAEARTHDVSGDHDHFDAQRLRVMQILVEAGADVNAARLGRHMQPDYPLIAAIHVGAADRVQWLLQHGADPHILGRFGTAIECAQRSNVRKVRDALEEVR